MLAIAAKAPSLPTVQALSSLTQLTGAPTLAYLTGSHGALSEFVGEDNLPQLYKATSEQIANFRLSMLDAQWQKVQSDSAYKWLTRQDNFNAAWALFERKRKYRNATAKVKDKTAPFRFLYSVSWALMIYIEQSDPKKRRRLPNNRTAQRALNSIRFIRKCDLGYLTSSQKTKEALGELGRLEILLESAIKKRQTKHDKYYPERRFVQAVTWHFLSSFDQTLQLAVQELCGLINYHPAGTTLQEIIKEVRARHR
jgi:hypothetical protein